MSLPGSNSALKGIKKKRAKNVNEAVGSAVKSTIFSMKEIDIMPSMMYSTLEGAAAA